MTLWGGTSPGRRTRILPEGGTERSYGPLWWRTWRYLQIDLRTEAQPLRLEAVKAFETKYPFTAGG